MSGWGGAMTNEHKPPNRIYCLRCAHYYVTWEPAFPYGCRALGFKSHIQPSVAVYQSSGMPCQVFEPKPDRPARQQ